MKTLPKLLMVTLLWSQAAWAGPSPQRQQELIHLLDQDCGSCHGLTRQGGLGSPLLPEIMADRSIDTLVATILDGRPGTPMPPWRGMLTEDDAAWLACRLKGDHHGC